MITPVHTYTVAFAQITCLVLGTVLLSLEYGWKTGVGIGLLTYVVMPFARSK